MVTRNDGAVVAAIVGGMAGFVIASWTSPQLTDCPATLYAAAYTSTPPGTEISIAALQAYCREHPTLSRVSR